MIKVIYSKDGEPISDFKIYEAVDDMIEVYKTHSDVITQDIPIKVSSELYLLVFGLRVLEGRISMDDVEFYFEDDKLEFDMHFGILEPKGKSFGFFAEVVENACKVGYENMKRDRNK